MSRFFKLSFVALAAVLMTTFTYYGDWNTDYDSWTAAMKQSFIWDKVVAGNNDHASYVNVLLSQPLITPSLFGGLDLNVVGWHKDDQVPQGRTKYIHTVGKACKVEFQMNGSHDYTGGWAAGNSLGIARFSAAIKPEHNKNTPGTSFKMFRDRIESASFPSMYMLQGQTGTDNFFAHLQSNHVSDLPKVSLNPDILKLKILAKKFEEVDDHPTNIGTSNVAKFNRDGSPVARAKTPFRLIFQPNPELKGACDGQLNSSSGFIDGVIYKCLDLVKVDTKIFKIWAQEEPLNGSPSMSALKHIGYVVAKSEVKSSKFMDEQVHFRHVFWKEELETLSKTGTNWDTKVADYNYRSTQGPDYWENAFSIGGGAF